MMTQEQNDSRKRKPKVGIFAILMVGTIAVLVAWLLAARWVASRPTESKWSEACDGVEVVLASACKRYKVGETIKIYVKFRNIGGTAQTIKMRSLYATTNWSCNKKGFADGMGYYPKGIDELKLLPGQTSESYYLEACGTKHEGAGAYEISGGMGDDGRWRWRFGTLIVHVSR
jgi:hypothetical protein